MNSVKILLVFLTSVASLVAVLLAFYVLPVKLLEKSVFPSESFIVFCLVSITSVITLVVAMTLPVWVAKKVEHILHIEIRN